MDQLHKLVYGGVVLSSVRLEILDADSSIRPHDLFLYFTVLAWDLRSSEPVALLFEQPETGVVVLEELTDASAGVANWA